MALKEKLLTFELALSKLANVVSEYQNIFDVCMVDFITKDVFEKAIPPDLQISLQQLSDDEISLLPNRFFSPENTDLIKLGALDEIINKLRKHTLESLNIVENTESLLQRLSAFKNGNNITSLKHFDRFMSDKKMHEVEIMSETISYFCEEKNVGTLIDLGSGKAYLSQVLSAADLNLRILAIDSSNENSEGAKKRTERLNSKWDALKKRADYRSRGQEPPIRSKHSRSKKKVEDFDTDVKTNKFENNLKHVTKFVDINTDLKLLLKENFNECDQSDAILDKNRHALIGLHTCGNLAPNSIKLWLNNSSMKFLCNVGCCYHHLDEEFFKSPYLKEDEISNSSPTFPLSSKLKSSRYKLGRNARMIASQPMDRLRTSKELPHISLLWRAILQHILLIHVPDLHFGDHQVIFINKLLLPKWGNIFRDSGVNSSKF